MMHVGLLFTPADAAGKRDASLDPHGSEQMNLTVQAIEEALVSNGHTVTLIPASLHLLEDIRAVDGLDVIFNACTGIASKMEQANVVGMLELLGIPFVGSGLSTHILGLHKHISKRLFQSVGVPTANFQVFYTGEEPVDPSLRYPLIIKPEHEGSSLGITEESVVDDEEQLRHGVRKIFQLFHQPALVEEFITGREFTIGVLGNEDPEVLPIQEITYDTDDGKGFMTVDIKAQDAIGVICPAPLDEDVTAMMMDYAAKAYRALDCKGSARIDVRIGPDGTPYFLEINTLPGMQPAYSDYPRVAYAAGYTYESLIQKMLDLALTK
ncbi:MAG: ATP-grasp domain-containing protein [Bacillota bacterium]|nr:ATP-grasp domain-containing protein [Bacillota bacterium]MDW7677044.1 ATP-grasp domain-containing protein [Bacillota bacterium]